jgi:hypothetical protein
MRGISALEILNTVFSPVPFIFFSYYPGKTPIRPIITLHRLLFGIGKPLY